MIIRKYEDKDLAKFTEFTKASITEPVILQQFSKDNIVNAILTNKGNRIYVVEDDFGEIIGTGVWNTSGPTLMYALMNTPTFQLDDYMGLVSKMVTDCLAEGYDTGYIPISQKWLLNLLQLHFPVGVKATVVGRKPITQEPLSWELEIDLNIIADRLKELSQ